MTASAARGTRRAPLQLGRGTGRRLARLAVPCGRSAPGGRAARSARHPRGRAERRTQPDRPGPAGPEGCRQDPPARLGAAARCSARTATSSWSTSHRCATFWEDVAEADAQRPAAGGRRRRHPAGRRCWTGCATGRGVRPVAEARSLGGARAAPPVTSTRSSTACAGSTRGRRRVRGHRPGAGALRARPDSRRHGHRQGLPRRGTRRPTAASGAAGACTRGRSRTRTVVTDISRLLALTGPASIAIDQLDTLVAKSTTAIRRPGDGPGAAPGSSR